jgi:hypothetical protein
MCCSIYFLFKDQKVERRDTGWNVCCPSIVYANGNSTETHTKVLLQQGLPSVHFLLTWNTFPWKAWTHNKISAFQRQFCTKWVYRASQTFQNLPSNWTTEPQISVIVPAKTEYCHRLVSGKKVKPQRQYVVFSRWGVRKESIYWCPDCEAGLCLGECFMIYHTNLNFGFLSRLFLYMMCFKNKVRL